MVVFIFWHAFGNTLAVNNQKINNMKRALLGLSLLLFISSCDVVLVPTPYDPRDEFLGSFDTEEYSETLDAWSYYDVFIVKDADPLSNVIYLQNFYGANIEIFGEVNGTRLTIPRQRVGYFLVEGIGRLDFDELVMSYTVEDTDPASQFVDYCSTVSLRRY